MVRETISRKEFEKRLESSNARLHQEVADAQERIRRLDELIVRKEAFSQKLDRLLAEIEQDEAEIAAAEQELGLRRMVRRPRQPA